jgi:hypothetical protein
MLIGMPLALCLAGAGRHSAEPPNVPSVVSAAPAKPGVTTGHPLTVELASLSATDAQASMVVDAHAPSPDWSGIVVDYLFEVYERTPVKKDRAGDFTWKDPAAARKSGRSLKDYVIAGMEPDFRELLYQMGKAMDAADIPWSICSGFRDDYRQKIADGFKARVGNSLHGGSRATCGHGCGRAADLCATGDEAWSAMVRFIDKRGREFGLFRPMPGADPYHVQPTGAWHRIAANLRFARTGVRDKQARTAGVAGRKHVTVKRRHAKRQRLARRHVARRQYRHRRHHVARRVQRIARAEQQQWGRW